MLNEESRKWVWQLTQELRVAAENTANVDKGRALKAMFEAIQAQVPGAPSGPVVRDFPPAVPQAKKD